MDILSKISSAPFERCKSLLCVQAHPGELDIAAGGAIAKLAQSGTKVFFLTVTDGSKGTLDASLSPLHLLEIRRREAMEAGKALGVTEQLFFDETDGDCPHAAELCRGITAVIRALRPEMVLAMDPQRPYEFHPDRRSVSAAAAQAVLLSALPHYYKDTGAAHSVDSIVFHTTNTPNVFVDIALTMEKKKEAVFLHATQTQGREDDVSDYLAYLAAMHGATCGFTSSEAFLQLPSKGLPLHLKL